MRDNESKTFQPKNTRHMLRRSVLAGLAGALLLMLAMFVAPTPASAGVHVGIFVNFGPPALPVYSQPPCPAPGYIWTPGYWAWDPAYGYYWVPGTWVPAPFIGAMWTPGYWGFYDDGYRWHRGYWGYAVGYYGGINYGFGYTGYGYHGGYWDHDRFYYNRAVNRLEGRNFRHFYNRRVNDHFRGRRVSYNGGPGGIRIRPTRHQLALERGRRFGPVRAQLRQERFARRDPSLRARVNHGRPGIAATRRPGAFRGRDVVRAERAGAPYHEPARRMRSRDFQRSARGRGNHDRGFHSFSRQRSAQPNWRRQENRAPVERVNRRSVYRNNQPRSFERGQRQSRRQQMRRVETRPAQRRAQRPTYRNDPPRNYQRAQRQSRPQEMRRVERRPAQQQRGNSSRQEARGGRNGHAENGHGHGRGGRH